ncbi:MAG: HAD family phosphatase [Bacteroidota bacterium]|nr:HAD family phosphatase [Bacteroidota bacterium]
MIKNIIFDFGSVLLNLDEARTIDRLNHILDPSKCADLHEMVFHPFERGEISEIAFIHRLQRRSREILHGEIYLEAWNAMILDFPPHRIDSLRNVKSIFKIFLLSNTNITHLRYVTAKIERENNLPDFDKSLFHKAYFSHELFMRKPEERIFQHVLLDSNLNSHECLFIDDKVENIEAAERLGIHAYHHSPKDEVFDILPLLINHLNG